MRNWLFNRLLLSSLLFFAPFQLWAQNHSIARKWNEATLKAIKRDFARPTVHARNLFHISMAMYDLWAVYDATASTYFLNHTFRDFSCPFSGVPVPANVKSAREEAISYASYRLLKHRFQHSPGKELTYHYIDSLFYSLGYDSTVISIDYSSGSAAALGNYIAAKIIEYGHVDGANEINRYSNEFYTPSNPPLNPFDRGNPDMVFPNLWQPLDIPGFIDQSENPTGGAPPFLSPEWGKVIPFSLKEEDLNIYSKSDHEYWVYNDPGAPPMLGGSFSEEYIHSFTLVSTWGSHLDPDDGVMIDISPASQGNINSYPSNYAEMRDFYNLLDGGDPGTGYEFNPISGVPYQPQLVPRGDYARVLAEFWADGPNSETPPGHWFSILNYVSDHPMLVKKMGGAGSLVGNLEWDVKCYFALGGALHDAAISAWGIKGYYDYVRPVSAIRYMAAKGQSSDPALPNYHPEGMPLIEGYVELIQPGDPLQGVRAQHVNKIKLYTWRGPNNVDNLTEKAGAGWILAEYWMPYQRPTFVSPPFAGYISGHSTFSRAAAEVLTYLTGSEFFPGGISQFPIQKDSYLVFEKGPSVDLVLQWAKYKDASDQCSLSRIWGGIHPPVDDIPGRIIGEKVGREAFQLATQYFQGLVEPNVGSVSLLAEPTNRPNLSIYPNPVHPQGTLTVNSENLFNGDLLQIKNLVGETVFEKRLSDSYYYTIDLKHLALKSGVYLVTLSGTKTVTTYKIVLK